jgi:hypothetical protein
MTHDGDAPSGPERKIEDERRAMEHGSSGSTADLAVEGKPRLEDRFVDAPYARPAEPLPDGQPLDQLAEKKAVVGDAQEALIDEAVEESFPASDPPSPNHIS